MDIHSELNEPITPRQIFENMHYWKHEDSGYQTSFTPESLECSGISGNNLNSTLFKRKINFVGQLQLDCYDLTKEVTFGPTLNYSSGLIRPNGDYKESPQNRRGTKRVFQEEADSIDVNSSIPTPTSMISGGLRKLRFNENHKLNASLTSSFTAGDIYNINENIHSPYPTTPIKKNCRSNCKLSSPLNPKRPVKKLNFVIHSISCDTQALQPAAKFAKQETEIKKYNFKPNQKIDIIKLLYNSKMMPPIMKIFNYLSPEDIFNFKLVSPFWQSIWNDVSIKSKKKEYLNFLANVKENQENKMSTPKNNDTNQIRPLMERHNMCYPKQVTSSKSPPGTPRTIRFKRYTKVSIKKK